MFPNSTLDPQKMFMSKRFVTLAAWIWSLPSMCSTAFCKINFQYKSFITLDAMMWLLPSVPLHMIYKHNFLSKRLTTQAALMWFLSSVLSHMCFEEHLSAYKLSQIGCMNMDFPQCVLKYDGSTLNHVTNIRPLFNKFTR